MADPLPAISLVAVLGRRQTLDIARDIERRGFAGIYMPSRWSNGAQCTGLAANVRTRRQFGASHPRPSRGVMVNVSRRDRVGLALA